jgi:hypothetical protein
MEAATPFWQQLVLNSVGPLITVVVGSLLVGLLVAKISTSAQDRRVAAELRRDLVTEGTEILAGLMFGLQGFERAKETEDEKAFAETKRSVLRSRWDLTEQGQVFVIRLRAYYTTGSPADEFTRARLSVGYLFDLASNQVGIEFVRNWWVEQFPELANLLQSESPKDRATLRSKLESEYEEHAGTFFEQLLTSPLRPFV